MNPTLWSDYVDDEEEENDKNALENTSNQQQKTTISNSSKDKEPIVREKNQKKKQIKEENSISEEVKEEVWVHDGYEKIEKEQKKNQFKSSRSNSATSFHNKTRQIQKFSREVVEQKVGRNQNTTFVIRTSSEKNIQKEDKNKDFFRNQLKLKTNVDNVTRKVSSKGNVDEIVQVGRNQRKSNKNFDSGSRENQYNLNRDIDDSTQNKNSKDVVENSPKKQQEEPTIIVPKTRKSPSKPDQLFYSTPKGKYSSALGKDKNSNQDINAQVVTSTDPNTTLDNRKRILILDIETSPGKTHYLEVFQGDIPKDKAEAFCKAHSVTEVYVEFITNQIQMHLDKLKE